MTTETLPQKYEILTTKKNKLVVDGTTLYRIKALIDIQMHGIKAGDIGGYIEKADNLSQEGSAWVTDNAKVFGNAFIGEDSLVFSDASVSGNVTTGGTVRVFGAASGDEILTNV